MRLGGSSTWALVVASAATVSAPGQAAASDPFVPVTARGDIVLAAPLPDVAAPLRVRAPLPPVDPAHEVFVLATDFDVTVFASSRKDTWGRGSLRRGTFVPGRRRSFGRGCTGGQWVELVTGGLVCTLDGVRVVDAPHTPDRLTLAPDLTAPLPYRYAKVAVEAPRFARLPTADEVRRVGAGDSVAGLDVARTEGVYFIAVDRPFDVEDEAFWRTVEGEYVRAEDISLVAAPRMRGEPLARRRLPLAFVHDGDASAFNRDGDGLRSIGLVEHRARFSVAGEITVDGDAYVLGPDGLVLPRNAVRVVEKIRRPPGVDADERWIHVDLDEQTLTAYDGDRPVYATLVSSGIPGFDTPDGLYRIRRKYVSRRMSGPDPDHGTYDIEEVPWTMYYRGGLALHGAYWHDEFGRVRSHGCTNVPPADARWLFFWTAPEIPEGWHGVHEAGTHVYFSRG